MPGDRDSSNNETAFGAVLPDLTISEVVVQSAGTDRLITARVLNGGSLPVGGTEVVLRHGTSNGPVLGRAWVTDTLAAGAYADVTFEWHAGLSSMGNLSVFERTVVAVVDEADAVLEFDESNNSRAAIVR